MMTDQSEPLISEEAAAAFEAVNPVDIRLAAMNLLARREHASWELRQKLLRKFPDAEQVDAQIERLAQENLQSDERFAASYARMRVGRGYGPRRIRQEMREKGLSDSAIADAFDALDDDWFAHAREVYLKKFGSESPADIRERARRTRFMQYRGFDSDQIRACLSE